MMFHVKQWHGSAPSRPSSGRNPRIRIWCPERASTSSGRVISPIRAALAFAPRPGSWVDLGSGPASPAGGRSPYGPLRWSKNALRVEFLLRRLKRSVCTWISRRRSRESRTSSTHRALLLPRSQAPRLWHSLSQQRRLGASQAECQTTGGARCFGRGLPSKRRHGSDAGCIAEVPRRAAKRTLRKASMIRSRWPTKTGRKHHRANLATALAATAAASCWSTSSPGQPSTEWQRHSERAHRFTLLPPCTIEEAIAPPIFRGWTSSPPRSTSPA